jgi:hypothetical protein
MVQIAPARLLKAADGQLLCRCGLTATAKSMGTMCLTLVLVPTRPAAGGLVLKWIIDQIKYNIQDDRYFCEKEV